MQYMPPSTSKGSGRYKRVKRKRILRTVILVLFLLIIISLLTVCIVLGLKIADVSDKVNEIKDGENDKDAVETTAYNEGDGTNEETDTLPRTPTGYTYTTVDSDKIHSGVLVLVNKTHEYTFPKISLSNIRTSRDLLPEGGYAYTCDYSKLLNSDALQDFNKMMNDFCKENGIGCAMVDTAYRSAEEQEALNGSTKKGFSDHHTGYLVSVKFFSDGYVYTPADMEYEEAFKWLSDNAYKYGFVVRYPENKMSVTGVTDYSYAYRYVGVPHAYYMHENDLCMEEYIETVEQYEADGTHLEVKTEDGEEYEVYSVAGSTFVKTNILVPEGKEYSISGDNNGKFIVTVKK